VSRFVSVDCYEHSGDLATQNLGCDDCRVSGSLRGRTGRMGTPAIGVLCALVMVAVVVSVDIVFFRASTWFWERLAANVGIVLLFGAFYFRFPGRP